MKPFVAASLFMFLAASFAGCSSAPANLDESTSPPIPTSGAPVPDNQSANLPPVANLTADLLNGTAPLLVNLTIDASDPEGGNLSWTLSKDGNETANGTAVPSVVNVTLDADGNHTFVLLVSDGELNATANVTIVVQGGTPSFTPTESADADGETDVDQAEIRNVRVEVLEDVLTVTVDVNDVWESTAASPGKYSLFINERRLNSFARYPIDGNPMTWDEDAGAYLPAGASKWDGTANKVSFHISLEYLESQDVEAPFNIHVQTALGPLNEHASEEDRCPDEGELVLG